MPGRIEMGAIVGGDGDTLDRPALPVRQVFGAQPRKEGQKIAEALLVADIGDRGNLDRRVGGNVVGEGDRKIDDATHERSCPWRRRGARCPRIPGRHCAASIQIPGTKPIPRPFARCRRRPAGHSPTVPAGVQSLADNRENRGFAGPLHDLALYFPPISPHILHRCLARPFCLYALPSRAAHVQSSPRCDHRGPVAVLRPGDPA